MQTFLWIACTYFAVQMICYWIFDWDYRTRLSKLPQFDPAHFPHVKVLLFYASLPGFNLHMLLKVVRARVITKRLVCKARKDKRDIAKRLRERSEYYKIKGDTSISEMFNRIADKIENLE